MRQRTGCALVLALLVAALPSVGSLCELRCIATEVAPSRTAPPVCSGHGTEDEKEDSRNVPSGGHSDCAGHVLLAKALGTRIALQLDLAIAATLPPCGSLIPTGDPRPECGQLESADLSPPPGRGPAVLRL